MASPLSLRLDPDTPERLERIARSRNIPASRIIREAVRRWIDAEQNVTSPYDAVADLIGVAKGGDPARSESARRRFARVVKSHRAR